MYRTEKDRVIKRQRKVAKNLNWGKDSEKRREKNERSYDRTAYKREAQRKLKECEDLEFINCWDNFCDDWLYEDELHRLRVYYEEQFKRKFKHL